MLSALRGLDFAVLSIDLQGQPKLNKLYILTFPKALNFSLCIV